MISKPKKRRRKLRPIFKILFTLIALSVFLYFAVPFGIDILSNGKGIKFIGKPVNLLSYDAPSYVDVQLLDIGKARKGKKLTAINNIVVHYTANPGTSAQNNHDYFSKPDTDVCSHFIVGIEGEIIQCVPLDEKSAASNDRNFDTVSIEVCHETTSGEFSKAAYSSLVKLTAWLCQNSGLDENDVIRHYDITGKICPKYFVENRTAWKEFKLDIKNEITAQKKES